MLILVCPLHAQLALSLEDITPEYGKNFILHKTDFVSPGDNGVDVIWDMTPLGIESSSAITVKDPESSPYSYLFPSATVCFDYGGNDFVYLNSSGTTYARLGGVAKGTALVFDDSKELFRFPMSVGDMHTDEFSSSFKNGQVQIERSGRVDVKVMGKGSMIIADDLLTEVIKVRVVESFADRYEVFGNPKEILTVNESYYFLKAELEDVLLSLTTRFVDGDVSMQYGVLLEYGERNDRLTSELMLADLSVGPNPSTDYIDIKFQSDKTSELSITLMDISGKTVIEPEKVTVVPGRVNKDVSIKSLNPGAYLLRLEMDDQARLLKVVKG